MESNINLPSRSGNSFISHINDGFNHDLARMLNSDCDKTQYSFMILVLVAVVCYVLLVIATYRFFRMFRFANMPLLLFFFMLNLMFIVKIVHFAHLSVHYSKTCDIMDYCMFGAYRHFNYLLFISAVLFNIYNWNYSCLKKLKFMCVNLLSKTQYKLFLISAKMCFKSSVINNGRKSFLSTHLEKICGVLHALNIISFVLYTALQCSVNNESVDGVDDIVRISKASVYGVHSLCFSFVVSAYFLYNTLKRYSYSKSKLMKTRLSLGVCFISIPLICKCIFNMIFVFLDLDKILNDDSIRQNNYAHPLFSILYYSLTELVPTGAQIILVKIVASESKDRQSSYSAKLVNSSIGETENSTKSPKELRHAEEELDDEGKVENLSEYSEDSFMHNANDNPSQRF